MKPNLQTTLALAAIVLWSSSQAAQAQYAYTNTGSTITITKEAMQNNMNSLCDTPQGVNA